MSEPDLSGDPREVDPGEYVRRAAPAAPPNVPELKEERDPAKVLPMREQMAQHRPIPSARAATRRWTSWGSRSRTSTRSASGGTSMRRAPIDASAKLPDGTKFNGPAELRKVLLNHSDEFLTTVTEKLLTYALGRGLEATDAPRCANQARRGRRELPFRR